MSQFPYSSTHKSCYLSGGPVVKYILCSVTHRRQALEVGATVPQYCRRRSLHHLLQLPPRTNLSTLVHWEVKKSQRDTLSLSHAVITCSCGAPRHFSTTVRRYAMLLFLKDSWKILGRFGFKTAHSPHRWRQKTGRRQREKKRRTLFRC